MKQLGMSERSHLVKLKLVDLENIFHNRKRPVAGILPLPTLEDFFNALIESRCLSVCCCPPYENMQQYDTAKSRLRKENKSKSKIENCIRVNAAHGRTKLKIRCNSCGQSFELIHSGLLEESRVPLIKWLAFVNRYCHKFKPCIRANSRELCLDRKTVQQMKNKLDAHMIGWVNKWGDIRITNELCITLEKSYHWRERLRNKFALLDMCSISNDMGTPSISGKILLHIFSLIDGNGTILRHMLLQYDRADRDFKYTVVDFREGKNRDYPYEDFDWATQHFFNITEQESIIGCCYMIEISHNIWQEGITRTYLLNFLFSSDYPHARWQYPAEKEALPKVLPEDKIQYLKSKLEGYFPGTWKFIRYAKHKISKVKNISELPDIKI